MKNKSTKNDVPSRNKRNVNIEKHKNVYTENDAHRKHKRSANTEQNKNVHTEHDIQNKKQAHLPNQAGASPKSQTVSLEV